MVEKTSSYNMSSFKISNVYRVHTCVWVGVSESVRYGNGIMAVLKKQTV
jgi:hypothetical protein